MIIKECGHSLKSTLSSLFSKLFTKCHRRKGYLSIKQSTLKEKQLYSNSNDSEYSLEKEIYSHCDEKSEKDSIINENIATVPKSPERVFPMIPAENSLNGVQHSFDFKSYEEVIEFMDSLIGLENLKEQIKAIGNFINNNNNRYYELNINNPGLFYNIIVKGNKGTGKNVIVKILYEMMYHLGVIGEGKLFTINCREVHSRANLNRFIGNANSGVVFLDDAHLLFHKERVGKNEIVNTLNDWYLKYKDNFVFIVAGECEGIDVMMLNYKIMNNTHFVLEIPDYRNDQIIEIMKKLAFKEKLSIDEKAENIIKERLNYEKRNGNFENIYTARNLLEEAIIKKGLNNEYYNWQEHTNSLLTSEDFYNPKINNTVQSVQDEKRNFKNPYEELNEMIGLEKVKDKVNEISAYIKTQLMRKEKGLKYKPLCLHMAFFGNPGTGKTTVARIISKIFADLGVISSNKFLDVSREDLVAGFVGQTAMKTAMKLKQAEGGVLFIDEAYSLWSESEKDFGYEAISTIIKKMEDNRDNLVIIFAGYPKEMERFINMNPGLRDRIGFKIKFSDYNSEELIEIFNKFCKTEEYILLEEALQEIKVIINKLILGKGLDFSNGRIIRNIFERIKMHQSLRVVRDGLSDTKSLVTITSEDVKSLYNDEDIKVHLFKTDMKNSIGFTK